MKPTLAQIIPALHPYCVHVVIRVLTQYGGEKPDDNTRIIYKGFLDKAQLFDLQAYLNLNVLFIEWTEDGFDITLS